MSGLEKVLVIIAFCVTRILCNASLIFFFFFRFNFIILLQDCMCSYIVCFSAVSSPSIRDRRGVL
jgi:hypothetical protein